MKEIIACAGARTNGLIGLIVLPQNTNMLNETNIFGKDACLHVLRNRDVINGATEMQ